LSHRIEANRKKYCENAPKVHPPFADASLSQNLRRASRQHVGFQQNPANTQIALFTKNQANMDYLDCALFCPFALFFKYFTQQRMSLRRRSLPDRFPHIFYYCVTANMRVNLLSFHDPSPPHRSIEKSPANAPSSIDFEFPDFSIHHAIC
jgi:hypothetical protein